MDGGHSSIPEDILHLSSKTLRLSESLNGALIFKKGLIDVISNGNRTCLVSTPGSMKRCGGQGDVLAGMLGTFANYSYGESGCDLLTGAMLASMTTREAARMAFEKRGHALVTPDIIKEVGEGVIGQVYRLDHPES